MAELRGKKLGVYWESNTLYFVETEQLLPKRAITISFSTEMLQKAQNNTLSPEGTKVISTIQDTLRKNKFTNSMVNLALPSRDIIFRTFLVPWMQSKEIKGVVEFEATKYIPFTLKELAYSFHAMNTLIDGSRRLRIIFVAIKKETLKRYTTLLEEAALHVKQVEPAPLSLIRALVRNEKLVGQEVIAIIDKKEKTGRITIVQENTPLFVREFPLAISTNPSIDKELNTAELLRLTNELRISLDYFNRQEKELKVSKILFLHQDHSEEYAKILSEDLELPVIGVSCSEIIDNPQANNTNFIPAYGAGLVDDFNMSVNFDLSREAPQNIRVSRQSFRKSINIRETIPTAIVCILVSVLSIALLKYYVTKQKNEAANFESQLGAYKDKPIEVLQIDIDRYTNKLNAYKRIQLDSNTLFFLTSLPELMPKGTWINELNFYITETIASTEPTTEDQIKPSVISALDLSAYAYAPFKRDQFQLINTFLQIIKSNEKYKEYFKDIRLQDVRSVTTGEIEITSFSIKFL